MFAPDNVESPIVWIVRRLSQAFTSLQRSSRTVYEGRLLVGTVVVAFILAFSRMGTQISFRFVFISDVLIASSLVNSFLTIMKRHEARVHPKSWHVYPGFIALLVFVALRTLVSFFQAPPLLVMRDAMPLLYGIIAILSAWSFKNYSTEIRARTCSVLIIALYIHLAWVAAVFLTHNAAGFDVFGPFSAGPLFEIRPDIDAALVAVASGLSLRWLILGRYRFCNGIVLLVSMWLLFIAMTGRAGQFSLIATWLAALSSAYISSRGCRDRQLRIFAAIPVAFAMAFLVIPSTPAGQRLMATFPIISPSSDSTAVRNAVGTQRARSEVWSAVIDWTNETTPRALFGSGFGNNFLDQAQVLHIFEGDTFHNVRAAHNWFVGAYARLGIVGSSLLIVWHAKTVFWIVRNRDRVSDEPLPLLASFLIIALLPVATLGVVLEAPSGAIPFFWASGVIMTLSSNSGGGSYIIAGSVRTTSYQRPSSASLVAAGKR